MITQQLFQGSRLPGHRRDWKFFVIARGHNPRLIFRLLYGREQHVRIYSSFAITGASAEENERIDAFKERLANRYIVFDPYKIVERGVLSFAESLLEEIAESLLGMPAAQQAYSTLVDAVKDAGVAHETLRFRQQFLPFKVLPGLAELTYTPSKSDRKKREDGAGEALFEPYTLPLSEAATLLRTIDGQIISRDYLLIDQSDVICALVPGSESGERPMVSAGSQSELTYGKLKGRDRFVVWPGGMGKLSPWIREHATKLFQSIEELEEALDQHERQIRQTTDEGSQQ